MSCTPSYKSANVSQRLERPKYLVLSIKIIGFPPITSGRVHKFTISLENTFRKNKRTFIFTLVGTTKT